MSLSVEAGADRAASRSMCSCSMVSGGDIATAPSSGRTSTPASRAPRQLRDRAGVGLERLRRELDGGEQAEPGADLGDRGVLGERRERVGERALELARALEQAVAS